MRIKRRLTVVFALAAATALGAVGVAQAINANSTATLAVSPTDRPAATGKAGEAHHPHAHELQRARARRRPRARLFFDKNITFNTELGADVRDASVSGNQTMAAGDDRLRARSLRRHRDGAGQPDQRRATSGGCVLAFNAKDANSTVAGNQPGILLFTRLQVPGSISCANPATNQQRQHHGAPAGAAGDQPRVDHSGWSTHPRLLSGRQVARLHQHPAGPAR